MAAGQARQRPVRCGLDSAGQKLAYVYFET
jgi:hypothetical protein